MLTLLEAKVQVEDAPLAGQRAQAILAPILIRRTKGILDLPPKDIELVQLQFSPDEREVYDSFEKGAKMKINKFIRERTLLKNHAHVLVMILRLRQLCCHPQLILVSFSLTQRCLYVCLLCLGRRVKRGALQTLRRYLEETLRRSSAVRGSPWVRLG